ncbi:hypothetical protein ACIPKK_07840 [Enterobacter asburiae]|jgi:hypothetical protein|uniref:hypothetical protein n=1 Tax=Enterobacter asburiae TaxID=61645 RepID=UPI003830A017
MKIDFFGCWFFHSPDSLRRQLIDYKNFHSHSEIYWQNISDEINTTLHGEISEAEDKYHESIVDAYVDQLVIAQDTAPKFHRESIFVAIMAQIEYSLVNFCSLFNQEVLQKENNFRKLSTGNVIDCVFKYIQQDMTFDIDSMEQEVIYLKGLKLIRNSIVHHNGLITNNLDKLKAFCNEYPHFGIMNNFIYLKQSAIDETINIGLSLVEKLEAQIQSFIPRHQQIHGIYEHQPPKPAL